MHASHTIDPRLFGWLGMSRGGPRGRGPHRGRGRQQFGFPGFGPPRGPRARRGDVRSALQQLEDEGLVRVAPGEGRKAFELTDEGRAHVEAHRDELGAPWDDVKGDMGEGAWELMGAMREIGMALFQLTHSGSETQQAEAKQVLADTRRALYRILAG